MIFPHSAQAKELSFASDCHPPSPQMTCYAKNASITPNHGHVYTFTIYKFVCLTTMNMKYLLRKSCTGCVRIYNDIQQEHKGYKREVHSFYITKSRIDF